MVCTTKGLYGTSSICLFKNAFRLIRFYPFRKTFYSIQYYAFVAFYFSGQIKYCGLQNSCPIFMNEFSNFFPQFPYYGQFHYPLCFTRYNISSQGEIRLVEFELRRMGGIYLERNVGLPHISGFGAFVE